MDGRYYNAAQIAAQLGGVREGYKWRCTCPSCGRGNLTISKGDTVPVLFWCHNGCDWRDVVDALHDAGVKTEENISVDMFDDNATHPRIIQAQRREAATTAARALYAQSPAAGTVVETYLRSRRITIPVPEVLRFHPKAPHRIGWQYFPAMVAPVIDANGELVGVHMTYLKPDGTGKHPFPDKALQRECRGPIRGGAVRLAEAQPGVPLIVAEGIETALSCMQLFDLPAWAALSTSGMMALELPAKVRSVIVAMDNDENGAGQESARSAHHRWRATGHEVRLLKPNEPGTDFNDVLQGVVR